MPDSFRMCLNDIELDSNPKEKGNGVYKDETKRNARKKRINGTINNTAVIKGKRVNCHWILRSKLESKMKGYDLCWDW